MKKQFKRLLSLSLVLCLLLSAAPVQAASQESLAEPTQSPAPAEPELSATQAAPATPSTPVAEEVTVLWEDETLRGEYEKHFLMSDGSYQAVVYSYPVHELVDGVWVEMNEIVEQSSVDISSAGELMLEATTDVAQQNIIDNYVWEGHGVQDNNSVRLYIGNRSGYTSRAYIQFAHMPTIMEGFRITGATMTVYLVSGTSTACNASAYMVTENDWTSGGICWDNMPDTDILLEENISHNNKTKYQFSCLEAVKHWYSNSTTGQNQNYGIMLRYFDEEINDYNSVYSADCSDAAMRPRMKISYEFNPHYSTYGDAEYYRNTQDDYCRHDDRLQFRANCYGYALRFAYGGDLIKSSIHEANGAYIYKQQPGEFADKTGGLSIFYHSTIVDTLRSRNDLMRYYANRISNISISKSSRLFYLIRLISADLNTLGYGVTEYTDATLPDAKTLNGGRLIAVVLSDQDYHFYVQHADNTWSHKPGAAEPTNCCIDCNIPLTNANIREHACEGIYEDGELAFLYINKDAIIDGCHADGSDLDSVCTPMNSSDRAGNYFCAASELGQLPMVNVNAKIDYIGDVDYYAFFSEAPRSYTITGSMSDETPLIAKLYDQFGVLLYEETSEAGDISFDFCITYGSCYFLSMETTGQIAPAENKIYQFSIQATSNG